jgi:hypothetical protein
MFGRTVSSLAIWRSATAVMEKLLLREPLLDIGETVKDLFSGLQKRGPVPSARMRSQVR